LTFLFLINTNKKEFKLKDVICALFSKWCIQWQAILDWRLNTFWKVLWKIHWIIWWK